MLKKSRKYILFDIVHIFSPHRLFDDYHYRIIELSFLLSFLVTIHFSEVYQRINRNLQSTMTRTKNRSTYRFRTIVRGGRKMKVSLPAKAGIRKSRRFR